MPSSSSHKWKYDVFVSFRGKDVRNSFVPHLFRELRRAGLRYFSDDDIKDTGEKISVKLFRAIRYARFAIVLFSENYAESKWCLDELVQILECRRKLKKQGHVVIPVFFGVEATELSKLTSGKKFARGFKSLCRKTEDKRKIPKWKRALAEVKHISGIDLQNRANGNEAQLIDIIIESLYKLLGSNLGINSGGQGGDTHDDGTFAGGRQITVRVNPGIRSITIDHHQDGSWAFLL